MTFSKYSERAYWRADRERFGPRAWIVQPSYWAVATYRFGRWTRSVRGPLRLPVHACYFVMYSMTRLLTGIDIPRSVQIGPGLLIHHFGGIIIHPMASIGARCTLRHGVTIGARDASGPATIGDDVILGAYAQVLGKVHVGSGATVGALSLVISDVAPSTTVVGIPARRIERSQ